MYVGENQINMGRGPQGRGSSFVRLPETGYLVGHTAAVNGNVVLGVAPDEDATQRAMEQPFRHIGGTPDGTGPRAGTRYCRYNQATGEMVGLLGMSDAEKAEAKKVLETMYSTYINAWKDSEELLKLLQAGQAHLRNNPDSAPRLQPLMDRVRALRTSTLKIWDDSYKVLQKAEAKGLKLDFLKKTGQEFITTSTGGLKKYKDAHSAMSVSLAKATGGKFGNGVGSPVSIALGWVTVSMVVPALAIALVLWVLSMKKDADSRNVELQTKHELAEGLTISISEITKMVAEKKITAKQGQEMIEKVKEAQEPLVVPQDDENKGGFVKTVGKVAIVAGLGAGLFFAYKKGWLDNLLGRVPLLNQLPKRSMA